MRRDARLASIDLNLLIVLDELLRSRSTVRAAERLGRTQSSISHALGRLREIFGDPLLVRVGASSRLTTLAEELEAPLGETLASIEGLVFRTADIDPATLARSFTISSADYAEVVLLPRLMQRLRRDAPLVDIVIESRGADVDRAVQRGDIDLSIGTVVDPLSGLVVQRLFRDRFVSVVRHDHPSLDEGITLDEFVSAAHALVAPRARPGSVVDDALAKLGRERRVALRTSHFMAAVIAVTQSDMIVTLPQSFVRVILPHIPLRVLAPPLALPEIVFSCVYAATRQRDPAHAWLRGMLTALCREIANESRP